VNLIINNADAFSLQSTVEWQNGDSLQHSAKIAEDRTARNCLATRDTKMPSPRTLQGFMFKTLDGRRHCRRHSWFRNVGPQAMIMNVLMQAFLDLSIAHDCALRKSDNRSESLVNLDPLFQKTAQYRFWLPFLGSVYVQSLFRTFCEGAFPYAQRTGVFRRIPTTANRHPTATTA
jgi:hypothetical protein